ncbi:dihydrofolate reductase family protein [Limibacter armeniacum]|uniref:dihydrofolate reductase family protein n=1 Tax=Limibacter armeniacum TaxID=466084 RepID=UPI002FE60DA1
MRKVVLYIATSMDGFIAKEDGDVNWLHDEAFAEKENDFGYADFLSSIDTTFMGNSTYKVVMGFDIPFPYPDSTNYVVTSDPSQPDTNDVKFIGSEEVKDLLSQIKQQEGKDIWLIGGGKLNAFFLEHGWIDEIRLFIMPIVLGKGIKMFGEVDDFSKKFALKETEVYTTGVVALHYAK